MLGVRKHERGAVSLFIVVLSALLITTITVAFVRIMIQDQAQARENDLSKSALDSAYAGVEDAKRALVQYRKQCPLGRSTSPQCQTWADLMDGTHCDALQQMNISGSSTDKEVLVQQNEGDVSLNQAYTCVKVQLDTDDFMGSLTPNTSRIIPLKGNGPFDKVVLEWYSQNDLQNVSSSSIDLGLDKALPKLADWPKSRPALMRVQLIQYEQGKDFNLSDFNKEQGSNTNNASLFLMPSTVGLSNVSFLDDKRQSKTSDALEQIICNRNFSLTSTDGQYACKATISVPNPIGATDGNNRKAYLRVSEIYNPTTSFRISMVDSSNNTVKFSSVQPVADSTGRANDLFRRISARIELDGSSIPPVEASVDLTGNLCKTFLVTDNASDYSAGGCQE